MSTPSGPQDPTPESRSGVGETAPNLPPPPTYQPNPGAPGQPGAYAQPAPGMPVYPQGYTPQPYGSVPYPGYPIVPQQRPPDSSSKTLWIVLGSVGGVLLLACVACASLVYVLGSQVANSPLFTAVSFCSNEQAQRYDAAYKLFSSNLQNQISEAQFIQDSQNIDATSGLVTSCNATQALAGAQSQSSDSTLDMTLMVTRGDASAGAGSAGDTGSGGDTTGSPGGTPPDGTTSTSGVIRLTKEGNSWKIYYIDPSLGVS